MTGIMKSNMVTVMNNIAIITTMRFSVVIRSVYATEMLSKKPNRIPVNVTKRELSRIIAL